MVWPQYLPHGLGVFNLDRSIIVSLYNFQYDALHEQNAIENHLNCVFSILYVFSKTYRILTYSQHFSPSIGIEKN